MSETKRLFFALQASAPWPDSFPAGRLLDEEVRHMTLAFLGNVSFAPLERELMHIPKPPFTLGILGQADRLLLLPSQTPRVIAWHVHWLDQKGELLLAYQQELVAWLRERGYSLDERPFLPHVTLARAPFDQAAWEKSFSILPLLFSSLHLYESKGNLQYESIWNHPLIPPFEEIDHTADIAFQIHGTTWEEIERHAQIALAFRFPPLLSYCRQSTVLSRLEEVVMQLNDLIARVDAEIGCPFKAVSFHGDVEERDGYLTWEMIVDV